MTFIKTPTKGMRDILPKEVELREYIISKITNIYSLYGFKKIETPCVEHIENIANKEGGENEKLIFKILKRGEKLNLATAEDVSDLVDSGLRYDLTVPLSRYYANNANELDSPFKALQIGNVWRADRPQKGRFRQFVQCDIDILGEKSNLAETELIAATANLLNEVGLKNYKIIINDRRILKAFVLAAGFQEEDCSSIFISLDKMDKIGLDGVKEELLNNEFNEEQVNKYLSLYQNNSQNIFDFCQQIDSSFLSEDIINNLMEIINISKNVNAVNIEFAPTLVRGMGYYTGPIFEIIVDGYKGSVGGGGRYDEMIGKYSNLSVPACGFSIGFERLIDILIEQNYVVPNENKKYAFIIDRNISIEEKSKYLEQAKSLRKQGHIVNVLIKAKNTKHQIDVLTENKYKITLNGKEIN